jgi:hypothetical protein
MAVAVVVVVAVAVVVAVVVAGVILWLRPTGCSVFSVSSVVK